MKRPGCLVTGGSGFIGSAVCRALSNRMHVRAIGRRKIACEELGWEYLDADLSENVDWTTILEGIEVVIHCAARVHQRKDSSANPLKEFRAVNLDGTLALARQAARCGVKRFVFLSSIGVHGAENCGRPFSIDDLPAPHSPYAVSKYEAEVALFGLAAETGMELVVIRPPLVYGPGATGNVVALLRVLATGLPLPLSRVTQNRRSYVYVENLVSLIDCCVDHPAAATQTFLVCDDERLSTAAFLKRLGEALGRPARMFPVPVWMLELGAALLGKRDIARSLCGSLEIDMGKTKDTLGWTPPFSVDEGFRATALHWLATHKRS